MRLGLGGLGPGPLFKGGLGKAEDSGLEGLRLK